MEEIDFVTQINYFIIFNDFAGLHDLLQMEGSEYLPLLDQEDLLSIKKTIDGVCDSRVSANYFFREHFHYNKAPRGAAGAEEVRKLLEKISNARTSEIKRMLVEIKTIVSRK